MKLITLEDYLKSVNQDGSGLTEEHELHMISECIVFIQNIATHFKVKMHVCGTALTIFHYYKKRHPFTEFDRYMLATLCLFLACKIDYHKVMYIHFIEYYYNNRKLGRQRVKPFEDIKENLKEDFVDLEFKILITLEFEFDFDSPYKYLSIFSEQYYKQINDRLLWNKDENERKEFDKHYQYFIDTARRYIYDSYLHPFCLYFPAPILAASCIYIATVTFQRIYHSTLNHKDKLGSEILQNYGLSSFIDLELCSDPDITIQQNHKWLQYLLPLRRQNDEQISIIDVMFLQKEILLKIKQQLK